MWYNVGDIITIKENCRLASGSYIKDSKLLYPLIGKEAYIVLIQSDYSQAAKNHYCHYKLKLVDEADHSSFGYFKVFHDDGICIKTYRREEQLNKILKP
jgi:hypothetical protein